MKLWIALGIAAVLGWIIWQQMSNAPTPQPTAQTQTIPAPPSPRAHVFARSHHKMNIDESNFVEAEDLEETAEQKTPDVLKVKEVGESSPLMELTNFEQVHDRNPVPTVTYGSDPKPNMKVEDRELRRRKAFMAAESGD